MMWRFRMLIMRNLMWFSKHIIKMTKFIDNNLPEEECYKYMQSIIKEMKKKSNVETVAFGTEKLPKEGGYVMYPNHQGKYDAYGIVSVHEKACTVVMDKDKSFAPFIKQVIDLLRGKRLDKADVRQSLRIINETAKEVEVGRRYIIFPEGEYNQEKKNSLFDFKAGCFKTSLKSKTPIVLVVLFDSYKAWNTSRFGKVCTQVHFLEPIEYEEYKNMNTNQIAQLVHSKIQDKLNILCLE